MPSINSKITLQLTCFKKSTLVAATVANGVPTFRITDKKRHVLAITLSTQENKKLLKQLESGFKRTVDWNKYRSKKLILVQSNV